MSGINGVPDRHHLHLLDNIPVRPVFIMGDHRSGTTLLYQLLAGTRCFNVMTAYDVIRYDRILSDRVAGRSEAAREELTRELAARGLRDRVIDGVAVTADLPEEYGFVIEDGPRPQITPGTVDSFVELCRKLQHADPARPVLLKNPWDMLRFAYIKGMFPEARFVFVHRDPVAVINSQLRAIRSLLAARNEYVALLAPWYDRLFRQPVRLRAMCALWSPRLPFGVALAARHVRRITGYFLRHIGELDPRDYVCVRYEDLCSEPDATIARTIEFLGVRPATRPDVRARIQPREIALLREVEARRGAIRHELQSYYRHVGYDA